ncbi:MAG: glycosyltransferase family 39 protein [Deltaproteobacteria bacterium]|nr:glycosyltransferase family 39 protein [Deltaproteobacteria bacterium]
MKRNLSSRGVATAIVAAVALACSLVFVFSYPLPPLTSDDIGYMALARSVAQGTGFSEDGGITPAVYRPPLFSLLLGGWFRATGTSSILSASVFQSLLHTLGTVAAFGLFLEIIPSLAWAFGAALFIAVNPLLVSRVAFVLQEPTVLLFTMIAAWLTVRLVKAHSAAKAALSGAAWGVCTLAKVVSWYVPLLIVAMRFLPARFRFTLRGKEVLALLFCFTAAIAPWTIRNYVHFNRLIPVNGQGEGLLEWNVSHAEIPGEAPGEEYVKKVQTGNFTENQRKELLWNYVKEHPYHFLVRRTARNVIHFAAPSRDWWILRGHCAPGEHGTLYWILTSLFHIPLFLFLVYRTWQFGSGLAPPGFGFVMLLYWTYWIEHALLWGDPRYGLAVYPILAGAVPPFAGISKMGGDT